jgi:hypothetical protein
VTLKRFYVLDQHTMNDDSTIETSTPYCIFVDAADAEERIRTLEAQCKEWERRTWEALDKLHTAIDHKIGARCEHGVWIADHCWECGKKRPAAETSAVRPDSCHCPSVPGEDCKLTAAECERRTQMNR